MTIQRRLDPQTRVLWTTITGPITIDDVRQYFSELSAIQGARHRELVDSRGATAAFGARDMPKLVAYGHSLFAGRPMAPRAVVVSGVLHFGMARLFASLAAPWLRVCVFDNLAAAQAWVEVTVVSID